MNKINLGQRIRDRRESLGILQNVLADRTDMNNHTLSRIETGVRSNPSLDSIVKIAENLHVSIDYLVYGKDKNSAEYKEFEDKYLKLTANQKEQVKHFIEFLSYETNIKRS